MRRKNIAAQAALTALLGSVLVTAAAFAGRPATTPELDAERDVLIDKLMRGVDVDASVARYKRLVAERDRVVPTSHALIEQTRQREIAQHEMRQAYRQTADYQVNASCLLAVDPTHPPLGGERRSLADWGRVTKKAEVRLAPKNDLDEGELVTAYEITGLVRKYVVVIDANAKRDEKHLRAAEGDLVLVCDGGTENKPRLTGAWATQPEQRRGFAARIASPPLIAKKSKWSPRHISSSKFYTAIREVKWPFPPEEFVVAVVTPLGDLGDGRWKIDADGDVDWVLEVPATLKNRNLLAPGRPVWVVMGQQRFDKTLRKLVLVAEDIEERYVLEK